MLRIRQLQYRYPGPAQARLHAVNLDAARGQVLGLLAPTARAKPR